MTRVRIEALHLAAQLSDGELRLRGRDFLRRLAKASTGRDGAPLLDLCAFLARSYYELRPPAGSIVLLDAAATGQRRCLPLLSPVSIEDFHGCRKLLEVSAPDMPLVCDGQYFTGFLREPPGDLHSIQFRRGRVWEVRDGDRLLCLFQDDLPAKDGQILRRQAFCDYLATRFTSLTPAAPAALWQVLRAAVAQPFGTNILITPSAASEAERLSSQGIRIAPTALTPELTSRLTAIDGTLLVDAEARAHAIGVILDGGVGNGNWRRGGRYNSAIMYCGNAKDAAVIIVISESGTIDLVPARENHPNASGSYLGLADTPAAYL